jgi:hypothetical protein
MSSSIRPQHGRLARSAARQLLACLEGWSQLARVVGRLPFTHPLRPLSYRADPPPLAFLADRPLIARLVDRPLIARLADRPLIARPEGWSP